MKTIYTLIVIFFAQVSSMHAQDITIEDLEIPNAPALSLLDETTTIIETPKNIKALTTSLANSLGNNIALEFSPYLLFSTSKNFYDYNGFMVSQNSENKLVEKGLLGQAWTNLSFSVASVKNDSLNKISFGFRTNLLTIQNPKRKILFNEAEKTHNEKIRIILIKEDHETLSKNPEYIKLTKEFNVLMDSVASLNTKPLFSLDIAGAYNHLYINNNYDSGRQGKIASWLSLSYNRELKEKKDGSNSYISLYGIGRFIQDSNYLDEATSEIISKDFFDCGGKVEIDLGKLIFAYEYVNRLNEENNYRSVGTIKYKVSNSIIINGGFGRNFEATDNLVSILGINWGLDLGTNKFVKEQLN
jgi:hypothetical protein